MDEEKNRLASVGRLCDIVARLRGPGGCPWDGAQTHESLKPACIEEAAEVLGISKQLLRYKLDSYQEEKDEAEEGL